MQIVIDIPDEDYKEILKDNSDGSPMENILCDAVRDGTPLPKGHGRLIYADVLEKEMINGIKAGNYEEGFEEYSNINNMDDCVDAVRFADAVIEADAVESEVSE